MDLTYKQDHMYIDGEAVNIPNAAAVYAGLLVEGIQRSMLQDLRRTSGKSRD